MSELNRAATAFSRKVELEGLKNIRFCVLSGREVSPESLAMDINRMDDAIAAGTCRRIENLDEGLPSQVNIDDVLRELNTH